MKAYPFTECYGSQVLKAMPISNLWPNNVFDLTTSSPTSYVLFPVFVKMSGFLLKFLVLLLRRTDLKRDKSFQHQRANFEREYEVSFR